MSLGPAYEGNMRRVIQVGLIGFAAFMLMFAFLRSPTADASAVYASPYTFDQTYATAVRLIRVDMGFKILEKDKDLGYVMFEYTSSESGNKVSNGSVELVETRNGTSVSVQLPSMPHYHEQMIIDSLTKKLSEEYGAPANDKSKKDKSKDKGDKDKGGDKDKDKDGDSGDKDKDGDSGDKGKDGESTESVLAAE